MKQPAVQASLRSFLMDFLKKIIYATCYNTQQFIFIYPCLHILYPVFDGTVATLKSKILCWPLNYLLSVSAGNTSKEEEGKAKETCQKVSRNKSFLALLRLYFTWSQTLLESTLLHVILCNWNHVLSIYKHSNLNFVDLILILLHNVIIVALLSHYKKNYNFQKSKQ